MSEQSRAPTKAELYKQVHDFDQRVQDLGAENTELRERVANFESNQKAAAEKPARRLTHVELEKLNRHDGDMSVLDTE